MISISNYYNSPLSGVKNRSPGNSSPSSDLPADEMEKPEILYPSVWFQRPSLVFFSDIRKAAKVQYYSYLPGTTSQSEEFILG